MSEPGRLMPDYGGVELCALGTCQEPLGEEKGAYLYKDLESNKIVVFCGDCARYVELDHGHRFKLVAL